MPPKSKPILERLMSRVEKTDTCWIWKGHCNLYGYGKIGIPGKGQGVTTATHRLAWELLRGPIPKGMNICHKCDNPPCCNPDHLFIGTQKDNLQDMKQKNRGSKGPGFQGANHPRAKITESDVIEIRKLREKSKIPAAEIASIYNLSVPNVCHILARRTWRHI